jgi:hypothetical protein
MVPADTATIVLVRIMFLETAIGGSSGSFFKMIKVGRNTVSGRLKLSIVETRCCSLNGADQRRVDRVFLLASSFFTFGSVSGGAQRQVRETNDEQQKGERVKKQPSPSIQRLQPRQWMSEV